MESRTIEQKRTPSDFWFAWISYSDGVTSGSWIDYGEGYESLVQKFIQDISQIVDLFCSGFGESVNGAEYPAFEELLTRDEKDCYRALLNDGDESGVLIAALERRCDDAAAMARSGKLALSSLEACVELANYFLDCLCSQHNFIFGLDSFARFDLAQLKSFAHRFLTCLTTETLFSSPHSEAWLTEFRPYKEQLDSLRRILASDREVSEIVLGRLLAYVDMFNVAAESR